MTTASLPTHTPRLVDQYWLEIVRRHSDAKSLARCGQAFAAHQLLRDALPELIRKWGRVSGLPRHLQILRLRKLLKGDISAIVQSTPTAKASRAARSAKRQAVTANRIPLTDISGMIDSVHLAEAEARVGQTQRLALAS